MKNKASPMIIPNTAAAPITIPAMAPPGKPMELLEDELGELRFAEDALLGEEVCGTPLVV
jgi:hypothetical protein